MKYVMAYHPAPGVHGTSTTGSMNAPTYWLSGTDKEAFPAPGTLPSTAEVVIIGGGLMGVATAYWLARCGVDVLLVEARRLAWGATGRNSGMFLSGLHPIEDGKLVQSVLREEHIDAGYERTGHLALAASDDVLDQIRAEVARRPPTAPPLRVLEHGDCEDLLGMRIAPQFAGGRWMPDGHVIHPARLVYGLATAAVRRGADIATRTRATEVQACSPARFEVRTTRGRVHTDHVVYACNTAMTDFHPVLRRCIEPVRGQVLATNPLPRIFRIGLAVNFGTVYWRQAGDGTVIVGGCRDSATGTEENTARELVNPRIQRALNTFLPNTFPGFPPFAVSWRWAGIMDCTTDGRPIVGALPDTGGQWVIGGFGGHGMPAGLGAGRALAETIMTGRPCALLEPFDPGRLLTDDRHGG
jgi:glycine/D-amino acid oxidase-like deaminating enzyme